MQPITRKLKESSWLAQTLADMIETCDQSSRGACLQVLKNIVNLADSEHYQSIYRENLSGKLHVVIKEIPPEMRNGLRGLAERYKDDNGNYIVKVCMTHDLNSAVINMSDLMDEIRRGVNE